MTEEKKIDPKTGFPIASREELEKEGKLKKKEEDSPVEAKRVNKLESFEQDVQTREFQKQRGDAEGRFCHAWVSEPEEEDKGKASKGVYLMCRDPDAGQEVHDAIESGDYALYTYNPQFKDREKEVEKTGQAAGELVGEMYRRDDDMLDTAQKILAQLQAEFSKEQGLRKDSDESRESEGEEGSGDAELGED